MQKKLFIVMLLAVSSKLVFSQGFDKGTFAIDLGTGLGIYTV